MRHDDSNAGRVDSAQPFICVRTRGAVDVGWVRVAGALDSGTAAQLGRTLRERRLRTRLIVVDLRELTFMDRSGARAVVDAGIHARSVGRRLVVMHGAPHVRRMLAQVGNPEDVEIADLHLVESPVHRNVPPGGGDWAA